MYLVAILTLSASGLAFDPYARLGTQTVYSESVIRDLDDEIDGSAIALRSEAGFDLTGEQDEFTVEGHADYVEFTNPDFTDRWRYILRAGWEREWSDNWETRIRAEGSWNSPSVEYFSIDELELRARLQFEPVRANRLRGEFRWRERKYDDGSGIGGSGPRIEGEYRHRFGRYHYLELDGRYESIDSANPLRRYDRRAFALTYTHPLTSDLRARPKIEWRDTDFPGRSLAGGGFRRDEQWTPELEFLWWPGDWRLSAEFQYRWRDSSDPSRDRSGPRVEISAAHVF